jgi:hypothetical protein
VFGDTIKDALFITYIKTVFIIVKAPAATMRGFLLLIKLRLFYVEG